VANALEIA
jgi:hypothetical protein